MHLYMYMQQMKYFRPSGQISYCVWDDVFRDGLHCHVARSAATTIGSGYLVSFLRHVTNDVFNVETGRL